jgi:hypothetical protein
VKNTCNGENIIAPIIKHRKKSPHYNSIHAI